MITVLMALNEKHEPSIAVVLEPNDIFETAEDTLLLGLTLTPKAARRVAVQLLQRADEIEGQ